MSTPRRTGPKSKRLAKDRLFRLVNEQALENDLHFLEQARRVVPEAWHLVEMDVDVLERKEKLTLYLDRSVAKIFKAMGAGYQARINRVLATWVQMKMAELEVYEMGYYEKLAATNDELRADPPEDMRDQRADTLANHWAFLQGYEAGKLETRKG